ncbi:MAG: hypothetical protein E7269_05040 [Lachnospiraceae bacterium]|nr:hypothetical protein [Lachnospiraceae bacterium]
MSKAPDEYSDSERRVLAASPELTLESVLSTDFMTDFEDYATDQFPLRDSFRKLKSTTEFHIFHKMDNNGLYYRRGHLCKMEYPLNTAMLDHAAERFFYLYEAYMQGTDVNIYFGIVPDKNMYLAGESGHLAMDYDALADYMQERTTYMEYIDLYDMLSIDDYYKTDTHWKQECIVDVAEKIAACMGVTLEAGYTENVLAHPFYGVYYGQALLDVDADALTYLTNDVLAACKVTSYDTGMPKEVPLYDMDAAAGKDPYEMFAAGSDALITIENPGAETERELVIFRDSFASSLAPLLVDGYSKITLVDIRYVQSAMLGNFIDFDNQDVLFLYSTLLLNDSLAMK